ncbi:hypothetical protein KBY93_14110 [Synechococcus sp. J7-Johnson]|nr:hypothetical protein [Synechococcus sp. J7-Johnson]MCP9841756.1 hypothetical protein [Synechococcus sp. J7-Johnson]
MARRFRLHLEREMEATAMEASVNVKGSPWERFSCAAERQEIAALWGAWP